MSTAVAIAAVAIGTIQGAQAQKLAAETNEAIAKRNARVARFQAAEQLVIGERQANRVRTQEDLVIGAQRAALAAQGIVVDSGIGLALQEDTRRQADEDILTIRNNAALAAWAFENEADQFRFGAELAETAGQFAVSETILGGITRIGTISANRPRVTS